MTSVELRTQRAKLVADARAIYKLAEGEKRSPNAEEREQFDRIMADVDRLGDEANKLDKLELAERSLGESAGRVTTPTTPETPAATATRGNPRASDEYRAAFSAWLRGGFLGVNARQAQSIEEVRAIQADNLVSAGFLLSPQQFQNELIKFVDNMVFMRTLARKFTVTQAHSLGAPSLDADPADSDWTSELATGTEDSSFAFGKRELFPRPLAKRIKVSNKMIRMLPGIDSFVLERLAYKFGVTAEKAYLTGNGQNQPLGAFVASANGISTGRDVTTGTVATLKADDLIAQKYALKVQYWADKSLRWVWHRSVMQLIRQLKDTSGQYLWQPGGFGSNLTVDGMDTLLGVPVILSEYVPSVTTSGTYVSVLGAWSNYWIADAETFTVQRLAELYAEYNQTGFIGRLETDGMPVLEEAFSRLKMQ